MVNDRLKPVTITVDEDNLLVIDKAAEKMRQSRSGYMEIAALEKAKKEIP